MGTDGPTDGRMDGRTDGRTDGRMEQPTNIIFYRGACMRLKRLTKIVKTSIESIYLIQFQVDSKTFDLEMFTIGCLLPPWKQSLRSLNHVNGLKAMGVWQGVAMDSFKFHLGPPCPTLLHYKAVSGVAHPQGRQPAAVFYPFGHPTPYVYAKGLWFSSILS
jgi:hypothetical protein